MATFAAAVGRAQYQAMSCSSRQWAHLHPVVFERCNGTDPYSAAALYTQHDAVRRAPSTIMCAISSPRHTEVEVSQQPEEGRREGRQVGCTLAGRAC